MENSAEQGKLDWDKSAKELFSSGMGGPDTKELLHSMPEFNRKQIIFHLKTVLKEAYERDKDEQAKIDAEIAECWYLVEYIDFQ
ncbi:MAG TPA: hypothetical protein VJL87_02335, partial [Bdellovibrionota bacterium]|nr:hypothetical protein [Bdellovibrionota bacterium]